MKHTDNPYLKAIYWFDPLPFEKKERLNKMYNLNLLFFTNPDEVVRRNTKLIQILNVWKLETGQAVERMSAKNENRVLSKAEVEANRSSKYEYLDFSNKKRFTKEDMREAFWAGEAFALYQSQPKFKKWFAKNYPEPSHPEKGCPFDEPNAFNPEK